MPSPAPERSPPAPTAATPMAYVRAIAAAFTRRGLDAAPVLAQAQITPLQLQRPQARITARQMERLSGGAMQALDDEALGAFSRALPWGSYGLLARASLTAPDLGVALKRWCRHHGLLAPDVRLSLQVAGDAASLVIEEGQAHRALPPDAREFSLVHLLRNVHGLACWYVDSRIPLLQARFPFPAPPHADAYAHMFPGPQAFGAELAALRFDARYLGLALRRDEAAMRQMLQRALPLTVLQYRRDRLLARQVRQALLGPGGAAHDARSLAAQLALSERTLHRQLREEGASLQQLKDAVRRERAQELLLRSSRPVKQVAAEVGFRNEKSFSRAFRAWTGRSPGEFRRESGA